MTVDIGKAKKAYVHIEMIFSKDKRDDVVSGLFKGMLESNGDTFVLLHGPKESTKALNIKFYDFLSIEVLEEEYKNLYYPRILKSEQEEALEIVQKLYKALLDSGFALATDPVIIDMDKYSDLPEAYKEGRTTAISKDVGTTAHKPTIPVNVYGRHYSATNHYSPTVIVTAEPEAKFFQRSDSKKPSKLDIEAMFAKLDLIKKDTYHPCLVPTPEDSPTDEPISENKLYAEYGYMNGMYE